jgi:hexokinase
MGTGVNTCFQNDETDSLVIQGYFLRGEGEGLWKTKTGNTKAPKITNVN